jgi:hypothetical protein
MVPSNQLKVTNVPSSLSARTCVRYTVEIPRRPKAPEKSTRPASNGVNFREGRRGRWAALPLCQEPMGDAPGRVRADDVALRINTLGRSG